MKIITLRDGKLPARKLLMEILGGANGSAITVAEMRRRCIIMSALEKVEVGGLLVDDQDHEIIVRVVNSWPWAFAHPDIVAFIDDVENARSPDQPSAGSTGEGEEAA